MADKLLQEPRRLGMMPKGQYSLRPDAAKQAKSEAGFTLIEMLVVVAILGMIAIIMTINVAAALKRGRLEAAAHQLQSTVQSAYVYSVQHGVGVFVTITPVANGNWTVQLIADTNNNRILDAPGVDIPLPQAPMTITNDILVAPSTVPAPGLTWPGPNNWPQGNGGSFVLLCSVDGRPFTLVAGVPTALTTTQFISITHSEMVNGGLNPRIRYDLELTSLWQTRLDKVLY